MNRQGREKVVKSSKVVKVIKIVNLSVSPRNALRSPTKKKRKEQSGAAHPLVASPLPLNDAPLLTTSFNKKAHAPNPKKSK
jgi:hypothetical protein